MENTATDSLFKTESLPIPHRYSGGYLYSFETTAKLRYDNLEEFVLPQVVEFSKPQNNRGMNDAFEFVRKILEVAPIGTIYEVYRPLEEDVQPEELIKYKKISENEWKEYYYHCSSE